MPSSNPEPTVVLYKSNQCRHCKALSNIWDKAPNKNEDSVTAALKKIYPNIRFYIVTADDNSGKFDPNTAPTDLHRYSKWFPMILLVPGPVWDKAMEKLGPKNTAKLVDGVQIMNGSSENGNIKYVQKYDIRKPADFGKWLKESLEKEDFKNAQNGSATDTIPQNSNTGIPPVFSKIVKPSPAKTSEPKSTQAKHKLNDTESDVCSLKIISRPR